jgi:hypothetical protein
VLYLNTLFPAAPEAIQAVGFCFYIAAISTATAIFCKNKWLNEPIQQ